MAFWNWKTFVEKQAPARDGWAQKRAFEKQRVGVNGLLPFPTADDARLFRWSRESDLAYACISKIVDAAQDPDLIVELRRERKSPWEPQYGHPLRQLLMRPNSSMTQAEFLGVWLASEEICGRFWAEIERNKRGKPIALHPLDPTRMQRAKNGDWVWRDGGEEVEFAAGELFESHRPDPQKPWEALAPLKVALGAVEADTMQTMFVRSFFKNSGVPSGIIKIKGVLQGETGKQRAREIQANWLQRLGLFGRLAGAPQVLDDNADYQKIGANLAELDSGNLRGQGEARICGVFGVPPLLVSAFVGLQFVNQRSSAREAQREFWANKMSPCFKRMRDKLTWTLLLEWEDEAAVRGEFVRLNWDMAQVVAMQEDISQRDQRARESFRAGAITLNEYRSIVGLASVADGNYYLRRANQIPITAEVIAAQTAAAVTITGRAMATLVGVDANEEEESQKAGSPGSPGSPGSRESQRLSRLSRLSDSKTYDWDGFETWREPTPLEILLEVKATGAAMQAGAESLETLILSARSTLIQEAVRQLQVLSIGGWQSLQLTLPETTATPLREQLAQSFASGAALLWEELRRQGFTGIEAATMSAQDGAASLDRLAALTSTRIVNDVAARAVSLAAHLALSLEGEKLWAAVTAGLENASSIYWRKAANEASAAAVNFGRTAQAEAVEANVRWVYSAILDKATCAVCAGLDGLETDTREELPSVPNPLCGGGYGACRCVHLPIFNQE